jgi:hypothetical protein
MRPGTGAILIREPKPIENCCCLSRYLIRNGRAPRQLILFLDLYLSRNSRLRGSPDSLGKQTASCASYRDRGAHRLCLSQQEVEPVGVSRDIGTVRILSRTDRLPEVGLSITWSIWQWPKGILTMFRSCTTLVIRNKCMATAPSDVCL